MSCVNFQGFGVARCNWNLRGRIRFLLKLTRMVRSGRRQHVPDLVLEAVILGEMTLMGCRGRATPTMHIESLNYPLSGMMPGGGVIRSGDESLLDCGRRIQRNGQRSVTIDAYAIGTYQVTNAQYARFVEATYKYSHPPFWDDERLNAPDFQSLASELVRCFVKVIRVARFAGLRVA